jgi:hypothetical protein
MIIAFRLGNGAYPGVQFERFARPSRTYSVVEPSLKTGRSLG